MKATRTAAIVLALSGWAAPGGARVEIGFRLLERVLAEQVFTQEGRKYLRGSRESRCSFAYLERPRLSARNGKIAIRAHFTGRSALDLFGRCVGLGGDFDVEILGSPFYQNGEVGLKDVAVTSQGPDSLYVRRVRQALKQSLEKDFRYALRAEARRLLEQPRPNASFQMAVQQAEVASIEITDQAIVLAMDLRLALR